MRHEFITCDKVGCGKRIDDGEVHWSVRCESNTRISVYDQPLGLAGQAAQSRQATRHPLTNLHLCDHCYEDVCAFINNKE